LRDKLAARLVRLDALSVEKRARLAARLFQRPLGTEKRQMKSCLVVDDSSVVRKVARRIIEDLDYIVDEAEDGQEAFDKCRQEMPDAILLDWQMPVMTGLEFLKLLRGYVGGAAPRVVYMVTEYDVGQIALALKAGANDFMMKPFDRDVLEAKFNEAAMAGA
jgi:two-component system chemotaxis response regulator CheY